MPDATADTENQTPDAARMPSARSGRLMRWATYASVTVALVLIVAKTAAWLWTDSVSMLSTLIDSLLDAGASILNLLAVRHALEPADKEHRFGHGKAEGLSALAQAAFIAGSAMFLLVQAGERLVHPRHIANTEIGYWVMVLAIVLTLALVVFQRYVVKMTGSVAITADSTHYRMDLLVNGSVMLSLFLAATIGWTWADPVFAIGIAAYILWGAWSIGIEAYHMLMDRELPDDERARIMDIARGHDAVRDLHDLRTRAAGTQVFIQMHLEMDGGMSLHDAHDVCDEVEAMIMEVYPNAEVIIHADPEGIDEEVATFT